MKKILFVVSVTIFATVSHSQRSRLQQSVSPSFESQFIFPEISNFDGSFQFICLNNQGINKPTKLSIHSGLINMIEARRLQDEDLTLNLAHNVTLTILSKNKVKASDFIGYQTAYIIK